MARIIYGVSGEGSGHSSRARVVLEHLCRQGHEVKVLTYDRGILNLKDDFDLFEGIGLNIVSHNNKVAPLATLMTNLKKTTKGLAILKQARQKLFKDFAPDLVLTDFEPMSAYLVNHYGLPLISIDNQHRLRYMEYQCPARLKTNRDLTVQIIRAMVPRPDIALATTFCFGDVKNERTFLFPPLLRDRVTALKPTRGEHILVYLTSGYESFIKLLPFFGRERFIIYGQSGESRDNLVFKKPDTDGFLADLGSAKAVMATAGFTLMTEALSLRKPYLALPMTGQFEQEINGYFLEKLGCGAALAKPTAEQVAAFLYRLPDYTVALECQPIYDNAALLKKVDELVADKGELARQYRNRRKA